MSDEYQEWFYLIVLVTPGVVLTHAEDEVEDGDECTDGVRVSPENEVQETNVVVGGDMAGSDTGERRLLVQLDILHNLEGQREVTEKAVDAKQPNDAEIA